MPAENYYDILGVSKTATTEEISSAFKKFAKKYHPDMNRDASEEEKKKNALAFEKINKAYDTLKDPSARANYDKYGIDKDSMSGRGGPYGSESFDFGDMGDIGDIFNAFFNQGSTRSSGSASGMKKGENLLFIINVTLEQAFSSFKQEVKLKKKVQCKDCLGYGNSGKNVKICNVCKGSGKINAKQFIFNMVQTCGACFGQGKVCLTCAGEGRVDSVETLSVDMPVGIFNNLELTMRHQGNAGVRGGMAGDLIIKCNVEEHSIFKVKDSDLYLNVPISIFQAILGGEIEIPFIEGVKHIYSLQSVIQPQSKVKIAGKGMPVFGKTTRGDLFLIFDVILPKSIDGNERELWKKLEQMDGAKNNGFLNSLANKFFSYVDNLKKSKK